MRVVCIALLSLAACGGSAGDNSALYAAIEAKDVARVRALLDGGADPNSTVLAQRFGERRSSTRSGPVPVPLVRAIEAGDAAVVEALLAKGARVDLADEKGRGPLEHAVARGNAATVRALLARGADPKAPTQVGYPLIFAATCGGEAAVVGALVARGAPVDARDDDGSVAKACVGDLDSPYDALSSRPGRSRLRPNATPLLIAAQMGHAAAADTLLAHGAAVDATDDRGRTALMLATEAPPSTTVEPRRVDVVRVLLRRGADAQLRDADGRSALDRARTLAGLSATHGEMVALLEKR